MKDCSGGSGSRGYVAPWFGAAPRDAEPTAEHTARLGNGRGRGTMAAVVASHSEGDGVKCPSFHNGSKMCFITIPGFGNHIITSE